jgi:transposase
MKPLQRVPDEKIKEVKKVLTSGVSIREAARICGVSYYLAWHVSRGSYDRDSYLYEAFKRKRTKNILAGKTLKYSNGNSKKHTKQSSV